jgi:hypothetical protein
MNACSLQKIDPKSLPIICDACPKCTPVCASFFYGLAFYGGTVATNTTSVFYYANFVGCLAVYIHAYFRGKVRETLGIDKKGSYNLNYVWGDCCCALWCYSCAMTQEYKMLNINKDQAKTLASMMDGVEMLPPMNNTIYMR